MSVELYSGVGLRYWFHFNWSRQDDTGTSIAPSVAVIMMDTTVFGATEYCHEAYGVLLIFKRNAMRRTMAIKPRITYPFLYSNHCADCTSKRDSEAFSFEMLIC